MLHDEYECLSPIWSVASFYTLTRIESVESKPEASMVTSA